MEVAITKIAQNGQIVIPVAIRKEAKIKPSEKFIVYFDGAEILLKPIEDKQFVEEMKLLSKIKIAENEIKAGKVTVADSKMTAKEIDDLLMK